MLSYKVQSSSTLLQIKQKDAGLSLSRIVLVDIHGEAETKRPLTAVLLPNSSARKSQR